MTKNFYEVEIVKGFQNLLSNANEIVNNTFDGYLKQNEVALESAVEKNRENAQYIKQLYQNIEEMEELEKKEYALLYGLLGHFEKLKFNHDKLINWTRFKNKSMILFTNTAAGEIEELFKGIRDIYNYLHELLFRRNPVLIRYIFRETNKYELISRRFVIEHEERLQQGICPARASTVYLQMLITFEDILWHLHFIALELKKF